MGKLFFVIEWEIYRIVFLCSADSLPAKQNHIYTCLGETELPIFRYLALGDSYTIGESVAAEDRWPHQLAKLLTAAGIQLDVITIARTGWTTAELWQGMQAGEVRPPYDLVSLLIGVNNQYRGYDLEEYREQFAFLLGKSIKYTEGDPNHVIVLSIPDWGVTPFASG